MLGFPVSTTIRLSFCFLLILSSCKREVPADHISVSPISLLKELSGFEINKVRNLTNGETLIIGKRGSAAGLVLLNGQGDIKMVSEIEIGGFSEFKDAIPLSQGRFLAVGSTTSATFGAIGSEWIPLASLINSDGSRVVGGSLTFPDGGEFYNVEHLEDGEIIIAGFYLNPVEAAFYVRTDEQLNVIENQGFNIGPYRSFFLQAFPDSIGRVRLFGYHSESTTSGPNGGINNFHTFQLTYDFKTASVGFGRTYIDHVREAYFFGLIDHAFHAIKESDNTYTWATSEEIDGPGFKIHLVHADRDGELVWEHDIYGLGDAFAHKLIGTPDGGYLLLGSSTDKGLSYGYKSKSLRAMVMKLNSQGERVWVKYFGSEFQTQEFHGAAFTSKGFRLIGHMNKRELNDSWEPFVLDINFKGDPIDASN